MKTKKALKLIKEILVLANELQLKQNVMKAVCAPIPEYKKRTSFSEAFEKAKNEYSVLKKSYDEIEKSMPFAHPLSEESIWQKKGFINVSVDGVHAKYNKNTRYSRLVKFRIQRKWCL